MTIQPVREALQTKPFRPFHFELAGGGRVPVSHPECMSFYPANPRVVAVALANGGFKLIDFLLVESIDYANGRSRRRG